MFETTMLFEGGQVTAPPPPPDELSVVPLSESPVPSVIARKLPNVSVPNNEALVSAVDPIPVPNVALPVTLRVPDMVAFTRLAVPDMVGADMVGLVIVGLPESVSAPEKVGVPLKVPDRAPPFIVGVVKVSPAIVPTVPLASVIAVDPRVNP